MNSAQQIISPELDAAINAIVQGIDAGETVIFFGAGISRDSGLPIVNQLAPYILEKLALPAEEYALILDENNNPRIPFEAFIQCLQENFNVEKILDIFSLGLPNTNHIVIAGLIKTGKVKTIVTTNFDKLLERALAMAPLPLTEGKDYDVLFLETSFEDINWSDDRIRIIKVHGSVDEPSSMAMTLKQVASQKLSKPRMTIIEKVFSSGNHANVLILGYSSSDIFDLNIHISTIREHHKKVYYVQHASDPAIEDIAHQLNKNPFRKFSGSCRIYFDTSRLIDHIGKAILDKSGSFDQRPCVTSWKEKVDEWFLNTLNENSGASSYALIGYILLQTGELTTAAAYYDQARQISRDAGDQYREGRWLGNLGLIYGHLKEFEESTAYFEQSLKLIRVLEDKEGEGQCYGNLATLYRDMGEFGRSIENFKAALQIALEMGNRQFEAVWLGGLGTTYLKLKDYAISKEHLERAVAISREMGDIESEGIFLSNLASAYCNSGEDQKGITSFEQAIAVAQLMDDKISETFCYGSLGIVYKKLKNYGYAIKYLTLALKIVQESGDELIEGKWLSHLGQTLLDQGDYHSAIANFGEALKITQRSGDKQNQAITYCNLGYAFDQAGDYHLSVKNYTLALDIYLSMPGIDDLRQKQVENRLAAARSKLI